MSCATKRQYVQSPRQAAVAGGSAGLPCGTNGAGSRTSGAPAAVARVQERGGATAGASGITAAHRNMKDKDMPKKVCGDCGRLAKPLLVQRVGFSTSWAPAMFALT